MCVCVCVCMCVFINVYVYVLYIYVCDVLMRSTTPSLNYHKCLSIK